MVENPSGIKFKFDEKNGISIKDIKMKEGGNFVVAGSVKWVSDVEIPKKLRKCALHDGTDHIAFTVWKKHIFT